MITPPLRWRLAVLLAASLCQACSEPPDPARPVEATLGPHRFMFPANFYYSPGSGSYQGRALLALRWPGYQTAPPARPMKPFGNDRVTVELTYLDRVPARTYLQRRSSNEATTEPGSLQRRDPVERLDLRVPQPKRWGLTPYAIDPARLAAYAKASEAEIGYPYVHNPGMEPDWYIARTPGGALRTFISCDPADRMPDGLVIEGETIVPMPDDRIAMCRHAMVDIDNSIGIELSYPRVLLHDWKKMDMAVRRLLHRYKVN